MSSEDFDVFYRRHDRGDGLVDVRQFLKVLVPSPNYCDNPLAPKSSVDVRKQNDLADQLGMLTGRRREVSSINGVQQVRFEKVGDGQDVDARKVNDMFATKAPIVPMINNFIDTLRPEIPAHEEYLRHATPDYSRNNAYAITGLGMFDVPSSTKSSNIAPTRPSTAPARASYTQSVTSSELTPQEIEIAISQYKGWLVTIYVTFTSSVNS